MKPRTDKVGLIITPEEADFAVKLDYAARMQEVNDGVKEHLRSPPIAINLTESAEEYMLDQHQAEDLWRVAFWAATTYREGYREATATHDEICQNDDIRRQAVAEYLFCLKTIMNLEADHYEKAKDFALEIDKTLDWSRSQVPRESQVAI